MFIFQNENGTQLLHNGADLLKAAQHVPCGSRVFLMHDESGQLVSAGRSAEEMAKSETVFKALRVREAETLAKSQKDERRLKTNSIRGMEDHAVNPLVFLMRNEKGRVVGAGRSASELAKSKEFFKADNTLDLDDALIHLNNSSHNQPQVKKTDSKKVILLKAKKAKGAAVSPDDENQDDEKTAVSKDMAKSFRSGSRIGLLGIIAELQALKDAQA